MVFRERRRNSSLKFWDVPTREDRDMVACIFTRAKFYKRSRASQRNGENIEHLHGHGTCPEKEEHTLHVEYVQDVQSFSCVSSIMTSKGINSCIENWLSSWQVDSTGMRPCLLCVVLTLYLRCQSQSSASWAGRVKRRRGLGWCRYCCYSSSADADTGQHTALFPPQTAVQGTTHAHAQTNVQKYDTGQTKI